jgi:hypothetical protein
MMSETLSRAINEKDVENTYRQYFHKKFGKDFQVTSWGLSFFVMF